MPTSTYSPLDTKTVDSQLFSISVEIPLIALEGVNSCLANTVKVDPSNVKEASPFIPSVPVDVIILLLEPLVYVATAPPPPLSAAEAIEAETSEIPLIAKSPAKVTSPEESIVILSAVVPPVSRV